MWSGKEKAIQFGETRRMRREPCNVVRQGESRAIWRNKKNEEGAMQCG